MPDQIATFLRRQSFQPGLPGLFLNPFFFIRRNLFLNIRRTAPLLKGRLLDFGCGRKPYENLFTVSEYVGLDLEQTGHDHRNSKVDVFYDGKHIPFPDGSFDALFCGEVLEHVFDPELVLPEMRRVLKPDATALMTVPFCWNEHEVPFDYARYSTFGIKYLLEQHGFEVLEVRRSGNFVQVNFQLWALYFFELFRGLGTAGKLLSMIFIIPINIGGSLLRMLLPKNDSLYFNSIITAKRT
ncbi:MAG TPA: class I SAM-dependent methyltransferase [Puia sp.]|jgi:SAM-dependent methyltransferase|nr:class I SAM-dependent methyltransferase [Puia sp.]